MSKLERAVKELEYVQKDPENPPPHEVPYGLQEFFRELHDLGLLKLDITINAPLGVTVEEVTKLGCKLIKLSKDEEKWEKVRNGDTSGIDDDDLKKAVQHLLK